jgi:Cu/Ag efflux protein CusF
MRTATIVAAVALAAAPPPLVAQQPPGVVKGSAATRAPGKMATVSTAQIIAIVERVDAANRTVSLKGPRGSVVTMDVGEEVRNLPQVKVGDRVVVTYAQALALELKKGGAGIRERIEREGVVRAAPGERPGAAVGREVKVVADVMVVNMKNQTVTLRGPKQTVTLKVRDPAQFKNITAGDQVEATYTEALALAVKPALVAAGR